jgi:flagellar basal-body rod protein FlgC
MSLFTIFQLASQGMTAQRERLEAAAANLANSNTTRTAEGGVYRRRDIVFETVNLEEPRDTFGAAAESIFPGPPSPLQSVRARTLLAEANQGIKHYQPDHPDADADGYVTLPDVDPLEETVNMLSAARSFEANATAFNTAKEMMRASLKLSEA